MKKGMLGCLVVGGILAVIILVVAMSLAGRYNSLVTANESIDGAWAEVENSLQRRADLIPNLVETVKGFAAQEKEIFTQVADARGRLAGATTPQEAANANAGLSSALSRLLAVVENYPNLKSDQNFIRLQDELAGTENRIAVARTRYNDAVRGYNTTLKRFPNNFLAGMFGFEAREYFEAAEGATEVPQVEF